MKKKYATLKEIADYAGVSIATASIVLNNIENKRFTEETCQRIMTAAEKLNYHADISAQMLKGKSSSCVGLIIPSLLNHFYPEITQGVTNRASELGYNVILFDTNDDIKKESFSFDTLIALRTEGIIVAGICQPDERELRIFNKARDVGIPVVQVDRYHKGSNFPSVSIDNYLAGFDMTERLIRDGHRRIAFVRQCYDSYPIMEREIGFREAMNRNGIGVSDDAIFHLNPIGFYDKAECVKSILAFKQGFTAVLNVSGDYATIELIRAFKAMGVSIPKDISVASFDGTYLGEIISPSLTTVKQPIYAIGTSAMDMLYTLINCEQPEQMNLLLPHELIIRKSTRKIR